MTRLQQILAGILVIQIILTVLIFWPKSSVQGASEPLLPGFVAADVITVAIENGGGDRIVLAKDGDAWIMPEAGGYPANGEEILSFLEKFESVQTNRLVTETEASHKRLKVSPDDFNRLIQVTLQDGNQQQVYLGNAAGAGATHIRAGEEPEVYLTDEVQAYEVDARPSNWIDTQYYSVPISETAVLTLENDNGTIVFVREGESWTMKGLAEDEVLLENNLSTLLNQVNVMRMTKPIGTEEKPSFELDNPKAIVTIETVDGRAYNLLIGAQNEDSNEYVVKWSESPYYVWVAQFTADNLIGKTREDFLQLPPTPSPASEDDSGNQGQ